MELLDSLKNLVSGLGTSKDKTVSTQHVLRTMTPATLNAMHRSDWLSRKIVDIPAQDMTRRWRSWVASKDQIEKIERYEQLQTVAVQRKVNRALRLARLFGGSAIYIGTGDTRTDQPLQVERVGEGGLRYLHVLQTTQLSAQARIDDPADPYYGQPEVYLLSTRGQDQLRIHPSRLVVFRGAEILDEQLRVALPWGDPILQVVYDAIIAATQTHQEIAALIPESKTDVIYVPKLSSYLKSSSETSQLTSRFTYANTMKSAFNMLLLEGDGKDKGEVWEQKQLSFAQLPELMQQFMQIVAGAADIPATRLLGMSPAGMNATGESDTRNYYDMIASRQSSDLTPEMHVLDVVLRRSAGVADEGVYYRWDPLWELSETERTQNLERKVNAVRKLTGSATEEPLLPIEALSRAAVNMLEEDGSLPGIADYVEEYGYPSDDDDDGSEEEEAAAAATPSETEPDESEESSATDMRPTTLYVRRDVTNAEEILTWAREQGIEGLESAEELHVTVTYSRQAVDWMRMGQPWEETLTISRGGPRALDLFGARQDYLVLQFASTDLQWRHEQMVREGASWDWDEYLPHITIATGVTGLDLDSIRPYTGRIELGPEIFEEVRSD